MEVLLSRREWIELSTAGLLGIATGCGTILHPERRNQPPGGNLDWGVVALDAVGLLLFFIPGIIAFAVDFSTGAIYLPACQSYGGDEATLNDESLVSVQVPKKELTRRRVEEVASRHSGREVRLAAGEYETSRLTKLDEFWTALKTLAVGRTSVS